MKKFLVLSAMLGAMAFAIPSVQAKTAAKVTSGVTAESVSAQPRRFRQRRVVTRTRITRVGRYRYRETIRTTYLPNGRTRTQVIRRVRLVGRY